MIWYLFAAFIVSPLIVSELRTMAPDEFVLNAQTRVSQKVWNASYPSNVERMRDDEMFMDSNTTAVLSSYGCTQYVFEFTPRLQSTRNFVLQFRTTRTDYARDSLSGIRATLSDRGLVIHENGREVARVDSISLSSTEDERIVLSNFAGDYRLQIGCDKIYNGHTALEATDAVVLHSNDHAQMLVQKIVRNSAFNDLGY